MKVFWLQWKRIVHLVRVVSRHGLTWSAEWCVAKLGAPRFLAVRVGRLRAAGLTGPERLRTLLEELGGTFVKFGQILALHPDVVPLETCNALFKLLDRVDPFPYSEVARIWRQETGRTIGEVFERFDETPLATASVGQVHVARYRGRRVAVKVQRPNVEVQFMSDIRWMKAAVRLIGAFKIGAFEWLIEPLTEFVGWTREELDFRFEARYSERVRRNAEQNPVQVVPKVYTQLTTRRVLVADYLAGTPLVAYLRVRDAGDEVARKCLEPKGFDRRRFAAHVIDNFLVDAFRHGIYHADLHPANLLLLEDSVVGYVDFGITGVMSRHGRRQLVAMTLALAEGDMDVLARRLLRISAYRSDADMAAFRRGLDRLAETWYSENDGTRHLRVSFTRIMADMLTLSRQTHLLPERDIVKYIRSVIAIDGLVTRFELDFDVGAYLVETCSRFVIGQGRREMFAPERFLAAAVTAGKLLCDGPRQIVRLADRLAADATPADESDGAEVRRAHALQLGGAMLIVALVATLTVPAEAQRLGVNLWTVGAGFVLAAGALLLGTVRRLAS